LRVGPFIIARRYRQMSARLSSAAGAWAGTLAGFLAVLALRLVRVLVLFMVCLPFGSGSSLAASLPVGETG